MAYTTRDQDNRSVVHSTIFPFETLSQRQRKVFTQFIDNRVEKEAYLQEPIWLAFVITGKKPAMEIYSLEREDATVTLTAEDIAETFDLAYQRETEFLLNLARHSWRLELLPKKTMGMSAEAYHRRRGCFFGYPEDELEYFLSTDARSDTEPEDLVAEGIFQPEEVAYTKFIPYRHNDSIGGYKHAIESGKRVRTTIMEIASTWNFDYLNEYTNWFYNKTVTEHTL